MDECAGRGGAGDVGVSVLARPQEIGEEEHAAVADLGVVERAPPLVLTGVGVLEDFLVGRLEGGVEGFEACRQRVIDDDVVAACRAAQAERDADERARLQRDGAVAGGEHVAGGVAPVVEALDGARYAQAL